MYGYGKSYSELLAESGFQTLKHRRGIALAKFAGKTLDNPQYRHWFVEQETNHTRNSLRSTKKYEEKFANTNRLYNSPLYTVRRILNSTAAMEPQEERAYIDPVLNDPFR